MELHGLKQCLDQLKDFEIESIVTDRHPGIMRFLRDEKSHIKSYNDIWHTAKGTYKLP